MGNLDYTRGKITGTVEIKLGQTMGETFGHDFLADEAENWNDADEIGDCVITGIGIASDGSCIFEFGGE